MVTALLCLFAAVWVPGLVILVVSARRAPQGFEDSEGFHAIEEQSHPRGVLAATISVG